MLMEKDMEKSKNKVAEISKEKFIEKAIKVHGGRYDYTDSIVNGMNKVIRILCPHHGYFYDKVYSHLLGNGCTKCNSIYRTLGNRIAVECKEFLERAKEQYGDTMDYTECGYVSMSKKVTVRCKKHNEVFKIAADKHLKHNSCTQCQKEHGAIFQKSRFLEYATKKYGTQYNYDKVIYVDTDTPIIITCTKHGDFTVEPRLHIKGHACPTCKVQNESKTTFSQEAIKQFRFMHGYKLKYDESEIKTKFSILNLVCPEHGKFRIKVVKHWKGESCPQCEWRK